MFLNCYFGKNDQEIINNHIILKNICTVKTNKKIQIKIDCPVEKITNEKYNRYWGCSILLYYLEELIKIYGLDHLLNV